MTNPTIYLTYIETGDYYNTHNIHYVGLDRDAAYRIARSAGIYRSSNYVEYWIDGELVDTVRVDKEGI